MIIPLRLGAAVGWIFSLRAGISGGTESPPIGPESPPRVVNLNYKRARAGATPFGNPIHPRAPLLLRLPSRRRRRLGLPSPAPRILVAVLRPARLLSHPGSSPPRNLANVDR